MLGRRLATPTRLLLVSREETITLLLFFFLGGGVLGVELGMFASQARRFPTRVLLMA